MLLPSAKALLCPSPLAPQLWGEGAGELCGLSPDQKASLTGIKTQLSTLQQKAHTRHQFY